MDMGPVDQVSLSFNFSQRGCLIKNFPFHLPYVCVFLKKLKFSIKLLKILKILHRKYFQKCPNLKQTQP